jgi:hypothetical protein
VTAVLSWIVVLRVTAADADVADEVERMLSAC